MANMSIAQENKKNKLYEKFLSSNRIDSLLAREILDGNSEQAKEILGILGFKPDKFNYAYSGMASLSDVAGFYGVKTKHLNGVIRRCGFTHRGFPEDYRGIRGCGETLDCRTIIDLVSPRMALAASALMFYGKVVPKESKPGEVFDKLKLTTYYARALTKQEEYNKSEKVKKTKVPSNNVNVVQPDAVVSMSVDKFVEMVVLAARKLNSSEKPEVQKPEKSKQVSREKATSSKRGRKVQLPNNWEDIVAKRQRGELSLKEAVSMSGLAQRTFYNHYNQAINN